MESNIMQKIVMTSEDLSYCLKHRAFLKQFRIEVETTSLDIKELIKTVSGGALHTSGDKKKLTYLVIVNVHRLLIRVRFF